MKSRLLPRLMLAALLAAGISVVIVYWKDLTPENVSRVIGDLGPWGPVVYVAMYLIAPMLMVPGSAITLAGGALFGPVWGTLYTVIGSVGGATIAFLTARYLAGGWVESKTTGIVRQVKEGVEAEGWRFVAFVRLVPLFPFNVLNYALGLTRIPLLTYVVTSAICMFPATVGYVYLGYVGREVWAGGEDLLWKIGLGMGILAALIFLPFLLRRIYRGGTGSTVSDS